MRIAMGAFFVALALSAPAFAGPVQEYRQANQRMHHGMHIDYTGNADVDFVNGMIPHHQGAVDMALTQLKYGRDPEMLALARWIINAQKPEIAYMSWWQSHRSNTTPNCAGRKAAEEYKHAMHVMHEGMDIRYTGNADVDFAMGMIPHHQGAVDMARTLRKYGVDPELRKMSEEIIRSQQQEIAQMREWLAGARR